MSNVNRLKDLTRGTRKVIPHLEIATSLGGA